MSIHPVALRAQNEGYSFFQNPFSNKLLIEILFKPYPEKFLLKNKYR
jgi:hypothetical protein